MKNILIIILVLGFLLAGPCRGQEDHTYGAKAHRKTLVVGVERATIAAYASDDDVRAAFELWVEELTKTLKVQYRVRMKVIHQEDGFVRALRDRSIDIAGISGLTYLAVRKRSNLDPLWVSTRPTGVGYRFILLVARGAKIKKLADLLGKKLVIAKGVSGDTPQLWLATVLHGAGLKEPAEVFGSIREVDKPSRAVLPVFFGQAQAAVCDEEAFDTMTELNPQLRSELVVLARSPRLLEGLTCFRSDFEDQELRARLMKEAASIHKYPRGRQILTLYRVHRLARFKETYLRSLKKLMGTVRQMRLRAAP